jgi:hypothetical protein
MHEPHAFKIKLDLSELYPELTPEQRAEAEYSLARYVEVVWRIYERVNNLTEGE